MGTGPTPAQAHLPGSMLSAEDLGTGPTPAQAHLPGSTLSAPEDSQRGAESCLQGHFPGSPAPPPASHLKTNFPRPRFPAPLSANGLEHWHPPRSGLRIAATGVPLTAPLAVGDSGTLRGSERSPDETDAAARQTLGRASDTRAALRVSGSFYRPAGTRPAPPAPPPGPPSPVLRRVLRSLQQGLSCFPNRFSVHLLH